MAIPGWGEQRSDFSPKSQKNFSGSYKKNQEFLGQRPGIF